MKRILFSTSLAAALLMTGCAKDDLSTTMGNGEMANVALSVAMGNASGTRATADYGTGTTANRVILEVYASNGELYKRMVAAPTAMTAEFDLRLVTSQEYQFVAWADYSAAVDVTDGDTDYYYNTDGVNGLKGITVDYSSYLGSDEMRDAFYGQEYRTVSGAITVPMTLTRPFGQLNLFTDLTDVIDSKCPQGVRVMYSTAVADKFDASTGETAGSSVITWASTPVAAIEAAQSVKDAKGVHLATDYILAPSAGEQLVDFNVSFFDGSDAMITNNDKFVNIPIKRNFRTNVSGELLTANGEVNMVIVPGFLGESDENVTESVTVATVAEAKAFLASFVGTDNVNITIEKVTDSESIAVPSSVTGNVTFVVEGVAGTPALIVTTETAGDITINNESGVAMGLDVTAENAAVYVDGIYNSLSVSSKPNTVYIQEDAVVDVLTVNKGNVVLYGEAKSIVRGASTDVIELTAYGTLGTIGDGIELVDGTILYNVSQNVQKANFTELHKSAATGDVLFVGAGEHALGQLGKNVTIYGVNKGVAGSDAERKPETRFISGSIYKAPANANAAKINLTIDGVELTEDFTGISLQGGGTFTLKNSKIIDINKVNVNNSSKRFFYTDGTRTAGTFVIENNYFALGGGIKELWAYGNKKAATSYDTPINLSIKGNVFDSMYLNLGIGVYDGMSFKSAIRVENNTFRNIADEYAVMFTPSSSVVGSTMYANGNTFESTVTSSPYVYVNGAGSATIISGDNIASK